MSWCINLTNKKCKLLLLAGDVKVEIAAALDRAIGLTCLGCFAKARRASVTPTIFYSVVGFALAPFAGRFLWLFFARQARRLRTKGLLRLRGFALGDGFLDGVVGWLGVIVKVQW